MTTLAPHDTISAGNLVSHREGEFMAGRSNTIRDVALRAGVSVGTVSKVFNNKGKLAETTRTRVLKAAEELNFAPNALIRSLQRGRTYAIGVFTWEVRVDPSRDVTMNLLNGLTEGIAALGCDTLLYSRLPTIPGTPSNVPATTFLDGRIDGLVVTAENLDENAREVLATSGLPTVVLYSTDVPDGLAAVDIDNASGIRQAVDHLVALGHRRIAFHAPFYTSNYQDRYKGYLAALDIHGITPDPTLNTYAPSGKPTIPEIANRLFTLAEPPTAILAGDDGLAFEWMQVLNERGLRVPEDVSLVGFDDSARALAPPGLTTIHQPAHDVGVTAIHFLNRLLEGEPGESCRTVLPVSFIPRGTTAAV